MHVKWHEADRTSVARLWGHSEETAKLVFGYQMTPFVKNSHSFFIFVELVLSASDASLPSTLGDSLLCFVVETRFLGSDFRVDGGAVRCAVRWLCFGRASAVADYSIG